MHKVLHPRDNIDRVSASRKVGGRKLINIENCVDVSKRGFEDYIKKNKERLVTVTRNNTDNIKINRTTIPGKLKWNEKQLYRYFRRQTAEIAYEKTWRWLRRVNLKMESESLFITTQNNAMKTNYIEAQIDNTQQNCKCRLCGDKDET